jgi:hypothetical protein
MLNDSRSRKFQREQRGIFSIGAPIQNVSVGVIARHRDEEVRKANRELNTAR